MKNINIRTLAALLLLPFALYQSYINYSFVASITGTIAFVLVFIDTQRITRRFQYISLLVIAVVLGFIIERNMEGIPFITIAILISVFGVISRMVFIKFFSYSHFRYFELLSAIVVLSLIGIKIFLFPTMWIYLFPIYISSLILMGYAFAIIKNAFMLEKGASKGYTAKIGVIAPDFLLPNQYGNSVKLSDYYGKRHVLLIFVRGDWCPYCHMIMRTYMKESDKFKERNIMLIAIGPDPVGINREMAQKLGLDYEVLSDDKMKVAQEYGIRLPDFELMSATKHDEGMPLPASFLIDKTGTVVYTSRTEKPGEFLDPRLIFPIVENLN